MTKGIALVTDHAGCGSFIKIPFADNEEFLTGQWHIRAEVGDELALFQRYGGAEHSFAVGTIVYVIRSGTTDGTSPKQRYTYLVEHDRKKIVSRKVALNSKGNLVRVGQSYDADGSQYCKRV